jgi:hypothetical protein
LGVVVGVGLGMLLALHLAHLVVVVVQVDLEQEQVFLLLRELNTQLPLEQVEQDQQAETIVFFLLSLLQKEGGVVFNHRPQIPADRAVEVLVIVLPLLKTVRLGIRLILLRAKETMGAMDLVVM